MCYFVILGTTIISGQIIKQTFYAKLIERIWRVASDSTLAEFSEINCGFLERLKKRTTAENTRSSKGEASLVSSATKKMQHFDTFTVIAQAKNREDWGKLIVAQSPKYRPIWSHCSPLNIYL